MIGWLLGYALMALLVFRLLAMVRGWRSTSLPTARATCPHDVLVEGGGLMGDALTCERCGFSKSPEVLPGGLRVRIALGLTTVRHRGPGETFHEDGVY